MSLAFKKFLCISLALHLGVWLVMAVGPGFRKGLPEKKKEVTWIRFSKGLGEKKKGSPYKKTKSLPRSTIRDQKKKLNQSKNKKGKDNKSNIVRNKNKDIVIKKKTSAKGGLNPKKRKTQLDRTIDDILAQNEQRLRQRQVDMEVAQIKESGGGDRPDGSSEDSQLSDNELLNAYADHMIRKINRQWILIPKDLPEGESLVTEVAVNLSFNGSVLNHYVEVSSGDLPYDQLALRAVSRAAPFDPLPEPIKDLILTEGFVIIFKPTAVSR